MSLSAGRPTVSRFASEGNSVLARKTPIWCKCHSRRSSHGRDCYAKQRTSHCQGLEELVRFVPYKAQIHGSIGVTPWQHLLGRLPIGVGTPGDGDLGVREHPRGQRPGCCPQPRNDRRQRTPQTGPWKRYPEGPRRSRRSARPRVAPRRQRKELVSVRLIHTEKRIDINHAFLCSLSHFSPQVITSSV